MVACYLLFFVGLCPPGLGSGGGLCPFSFLEGYGALFVGFSFKSHPITLLPEPIDRSEAVGPIARRDHNQNHCHAQPKGSVRSATRRHNPPNHFDSHTDECQILCIWTP